MERKKQVLAIAGVACIVFASFAVLVYAAWTPDDMANYMFNIGRHKIYQTNRILYNKIGPIVDVIDEKIDVVDEKMGQGLVGQFIEGSVKTKVASKVTIWEYKPGGKPKKVSLYVNVNEMEVEDLVFIHVLYSIKGAAVELDDQKSWKVMESSITKTLRHRFYGQQGYPGKLILDQLPVATHIQVLVYQERGTSFTIHYQVIIEEL